MGLIKLMIGSCQIADSSEVPLDSINIIVVNCGRPGFYLAILATAINSINEFNINARSGRSV